MLLWVRSKPPLSSSFRVPRRLTCVPGSLLAAIDKVLGELKDKVPEIEGPADDLSQAISDFEDAAKDIDIPTPTA